MFRNIYFAAVALDHERHRVELEEEIAALSVQRGLTVPVNQPSTQNAHSKKTISFYTGSSSPPNSKKKIASFLRIVLEFVQSNRE